MEIPEVLTPSAGGIYSRGCAVLRILIRHDTPSIRWLGDATRLDDVQTTVYTNPGRDGVLTGEWATPESVDTRHSVATTTPATAT